MNYIYDITLNLNKDLIDFYDWNKSDKVDFFIKIPIIKINDKVMNDFINNNIIISDKILDLIKNKSENYSRCNMDYICIFSSNDISIGIRFNNKGESILKSHINIEEEQDVLEYVKLLNETNIDYKIISKCNKELFVTRNEKLLFKRTNTFINYIYDNKMDELLEYIFYEIYNEKSNNREYIYKKLSDMINNNEKRIIKLNNLIEKMINLKAYIK